MFCFCKRRMDFKFNPVQSLGIFRNLGFLTKISCKLLTFYQVICETIANLTYINISVYLHAVYVSSSILFPGFWLKALVFYKRFFNIPNMFSIFVNPYCFWTVSLKPLRFGWLSEYRPSILHDFHKKACSFEKRFN